MEMHHRDEKGGGKVPLLPTGPSVERQHCCRFMLVSEYFVYRGQNWGIPPASKRYLLGIAQQHKGGVQNFWRNTRWIWGWSHNLRMINTGDRCSAGRRVTKNPQPSSSRWEYKSIVIIWFPQHSFDIMGILDFKGWQDGWKDKLNYVIVSSMKQDRTCCKRLSLCAWTNH